MAIPVLCYLFVIGVPPAQRTLSFPSAAAPSSHSARAPLTRILMP